MGERKKKKKREKRKRLDDSPRAWTAVLTVHREWAGANPRAEKIVVWA